MDLIQKAGECIRSGQLVAFPTETVYGLGADATNDKAVAEIFMVKGRPQFNPLITHIASLEMLENLVEIPKNVYPLMEKFWPGPITFVLKRKQKCPISLLVSAGLDTMGVRMPKHQMALDFIKAANRPIAAPSANISGKVSPTKALHVQKEIGNKIACVLDGGDCSVGVESTVLLCEPNFVILRAGGVVKEEIEEIVHEKIIYSTHDNKAPKSPGQLLNHYAPNKPLRRNAIEIEKDETLIGFGPKSKASINLSKKGDLKEACANLFAYLRMVDANEKVKKIAIEPIPEEGIGIAMNDRIYRACYNK